jgi:hypothetical protein
MRRSFLAAAVVAVALPIAACGDSNNTSTTTSTSAAPTSAASGASDDEVAWVDKVCGEITDLVDAQGSTPPDLQGSDPQAALQAFDQYLGSNITVVEQTINDLKGIGDSPVDGGDEALSALVGGLESLKAGYQTTKDKFATVNSADPAAAQQALMDAVTGLSQSAQEFGTALESVGNTEAIEEAGNQAPNCQELDALDTAAPTTTS